MGSPSSRGEFCDLIRNSYVHLTNTFLCDLIIMQDGAGDVAHLFVLHRIPGLLHHHAVDGREKGGEDRRK